MSYVTTEGTGGGLGEDRGVGPVVVRKLTESQGSRSTTYEVAANTARVRARRPQGQPPAADKPDIASYEHVRSLLRRAEENAQALLETDDPRDAALLGLNLHTTLRELWLHRKVREVEWAEAVNLLQIVLAGEEFETLPTARRRIIAKIFEEGLLVRTVTRSDVGRVFQLLSQSGFDPWRAIGEIDFQG